MNPPQESSINEQNDQEDTIFFDALDHDLPFSTLHSSQSSSSSSSSIIDPPSIFYDSVQSHHSFNNLRRRYPPHARKNHSFGCEADFINKRRFSFNKQASFENPMNLNNDNLVDKSHLIQKQDDGFSRITKSLPNSRNLDEIVNEKSDLIEDQDGFSVNEKCDLIQEKDESSTVINELREEKDVDKESTFTSAARENDDEIDSAGGWNVLEFIVELLIKTIGFQVHLFVMFTTYPLWFLYHACVFFISPFSKMRLGKRILKVVLSKVGDGLPVDGIIGNGMPIGRLALRYGWGLLWAGYVCFVLVGLVGSSIMISGYFMKMFVEKPIHMREVLNFDYTKETPVAYVPLLSCSSIGNGVDSEMETQIIPPRHKVQVIVSLLVPESEYNRHLGIFQVRVDLLSSNGKTISSSSQPAMLRFKSEPIRLVWTFLKMAPVLTGHISETQTLNVKIRGFTEKNDFPTSCLKVTLEHRAEYRSGAGIPEIYDAHLVLESELPFLKRMLWQWKMTIFIWITIVSFIFEVLLLLLCCTPIFFPGIRRMGGSSRTNTHNNPVETSG